MLDAFREVVVVDTEFTTIAGERPEPVCLVAHELRSGRRFRIFEGQFGSTPPYATGPGVLFVAFYASAELGVYRMLGWSRPERVLDLFVEFRNRTNGLPIPAGSSLLGALAYFGLDAMGAVEKHEMQEAIGNGTWRGRFTPEEILDYCEGDVEALARLLLAMLPGIDLPRALLLRGRFMAAAAAMEHAGVLIDKEMLARLRRYWADIQDKLIAAIDKDYGMFDGRTFRVEHWERWLAAHGIPWPRLESGKSGCRPTRFCRAGSAICSRAQSNDLRTMCAGSMPISTIRPEPGPSRGGLSPRSSGIPENFIPASASS
jgi:hypothetical protein